MGTNLQHLGTLKDAQEALRHLSIETTGDVCVQTVETSVLKAMNARTLKILADSNVSAMESSTPKRRSPRAAQQLDQVGPGSDFSGDHK